MSDLADMRRRAARQAGYGNYWAGKTVGLIDQLTQEASTTVRLKPGTQGAGTVRQAYRLFRRRGFPRRDARLLAAGIAVAFEQPVALRSGKKQEGGSG